MESEPFLISNSPIRALRSIDLPDPLGPIIIVRLELSTCRLMSCRTAGSPKVQSLALKMHFSAGICASQIEDVVNGSRECRVGLAVLLPGKTLSFGDIVAAGNSLWSGFCGERRYF
jgi:hypothetical protein